MPKLYGIGASPFVRKVRVALAEKGIAYEHEPTIPVNVSAEYKKISPLGKIPAYVDDTGRALADSSVICAYLERTHPQPALYPTDPYEFARALWFEEYADSAIVNDFGPKIFAERVLAKRFFNREPNLEQAEKAIKEDVPPICAYLESQLTGDWLAGNQFSVGDIAVCSQFVNLFIAGVAVDTQKFPKLARYVARVHERPSFKNCIEEDKALFA